MELYSSGVGFLVLDYVGRDEDLGLRTAEIIAAALLSNLYFIRT